MDDLAHNKASVPSIAMLDINQSVDPAQMTQLHGKTVPFMDDVSETKTWGFSTTTSSTTKEWSLLIQ